MKGILNSEFSIQNVRCAPSLGILNSEFWILDS
jgi:hypothetical protein